MDFKLEETCFHGVICSVVPNDLIKRHDSVFNGNILFSIGRAILQGESRFHRAINSLAFSHIDLLVYCRPTMSQSDNYKSVSR